MNDKAVQTNLRVAPTHSPGRRPGLNHAPFEVVKGDKVMTFARLREIYHDPYSATAGEIRWLITQMGDKKMLGRLAHKGGPRPKVELGGPIEEAG